MNLTVKKKEFVVERSRRKGQYLMPGREPPPGKGIAKDHAKSKVSEKTITSNPKLMKQKKKIS
jgi:hypothetical protein